MVYSFAPLFHSTPPASSTDDGKTGPFPFGNWKKGLRRRHGAIVCLFVFVWDWETLDEEGDSLWLCAWKPDLCVCVEERKRHSTNSGLMKLSRCLLMPSMLKTDRGSKKKQVLMLWKVILWERALIPSIFHRVICIIMWTHGTSLVWEFNLFELLVKLVFVFLMRVTAIHNGSGY